KIATIHASSGFIRGIPSFRPGRSQRAQKLQIASLHLRAPEMRAIPPTLKVSLSFGRSRAHVICPAEFDRQIPAVDEAGFAQASSKCLYKMRGILGRPGAEIPDHWHHCLLRARRERPRGRCATEKRDELATAAHSITSSARASTVVGMSRPNAFAVLRLITSS